VDGISRGGEAALLIGTHYPDRVAGVVALVPSSVANRSPNGDHVAWTWRGKPLTTSPDDHDVTGTLVPGSLIPVNQIPVPLFLLCAQVDTIWPSCPATKEIQPERGSGRGDVVVMAIGADHGAGTLAPNLPTGATKEGEFDALGRIQGWSLLIPYLAKVSRGT
jgi:dienelactone hydrolase